MDAADAGLVPALFFAVTVKVYAVALVRPVTVNGLPAPFADILPGFEVAVYPVIALPPVSPGGENVIVAWPLAAVAVPIVGAPGGSAGVTVLDAADAKLVPIAFVAVTVKLYAVPLVRPVTVSEVARPVAMILPG